MKLFLPGHPGAVALRNGVLDRQGEPVGFVRPGARVRALVEASPVCPETSPVAVHLPAAGMHPVQLL